MISLFNCRFHKSFSGQPVQTVFGNNNPQRVLQQSESGSQNAGISGNNNTTQSNMTASQLLRQQQNPQPSMNEEAKCY
jgi:hypothetical protein